MKKFLISLCAVLTLPAVAAARLSVVATLPVFADIAAAVGGERVRATALSSGRKDPHHLTALPSFALRLARADVFIEAGLDLETAWTVPLLREAGNPRIAPGGAGYVRTAAGISLREIPSGPVDRSGGDIHIHGNPHYWNDPVNGILIARNIRDALIRVDPAHRAVYEANFTRFAARIKALAERLLAAFAPHAGKRIVVHHREWVYFLARFGLVETASIEEKPGVEPGIARVERLVTLLAATPPQLILIASHNPDRYAKYLSEKSGIPWLSLPNDLGVVPEAATYEKLIEYTAQRILAILEKSGR